MNSVTAKSPAGHAQPLRHPDLASPKLMARRAWWLVLLGWVIPGSAQALAGNRRLAKLGLAATLIAWFALVVTAVVAVLSPKALMGLLSNPAVLTVVGVLLWAYAIIWVVLGVNTLVLVRLVRLPSGSRAGVALVGAVLILISAFSAVFMQQALNVLGSLLGAKDKISALMDDFKHGDDEAMRRHADDIASLTARANSSASSPLWAIAGATPFIGGNFTAVAETTKAAHVIVRDGMPSVVELLSNIDFDTLKLKGGGFDLSQLQGIDEYLPTISAAFNEAQTHTARISRAGLLGPVESNIGMVVDLVEQGTPLLEVASEHMPSILDLLGANGPRTYALMFQNNAEIRSTGGNPGDGAILEVNNGKVKMRVDPTVVAFIDQGHSGFTGNGQLEPWEASTLFEGDTPGYSQNFTRYPDFRDAAQAEATLWTTATGGQLDGVIAVDPVLLSYMLEVTGPIDIGDGEEKLTADNAVQVLLSDTYERFGNDGKAADRFFGKAASAIFAKVSSFDWDVLGMLAQLQRGVDQQRLYMWFPDEGAQAFAEEFGVTGELTDSNAEVTQTGIYLNDTSHSKLEYWLGTSMNVTCNAGERTMTTSITLKNSMPDRIQSEYTLGQRSEYLGYSRRDILLEVLSFSLPGGELVQTSPETGDAIEANMWGVSDREGLMHNRHGRSLFIAVEPGASQEVSFTSTIPEDAIGKPLQVRYSPTVGDTPVKVAGSCTDLFAEAEE